MVTKPLHQRAFYIGVAAVTGMLALGEFLHSVHAATELVSPRVTYVGSVVVIAITVSLEFTLRYVRPRWIAREHQARIRGLGSHTLAAIAGMLILLWLPRFLPGHASQVPAAGRVPNVVETASYAYLAPGVWVDNSRWILTLHHVGKAPLFNVHVILDDQDRVGVIRAQPFAAPSAVAATHSEVTFAEIDPARNDNPLLQWSPLRKTSMHLKVTVLHRFGSIIEDLQVIRIGNNWQYRLRANDATTQQVILDCADHLFPGVGELRLPPCFPRFTV